MENTSYIEMLMHPQPFPTQKVMNVQNNDWLTLICSATEKGKNKWNIQLNIHLHFCNPATQMSNFPIVRMCYVLD
jgi:hypothetical protein